MKLLSMFSVSVEFNQFTILIAAVASLLPDVGVLIHDMKHHHGPSHSPLVWLIISVMAIVLNFQIGLVLFVAITLHLITDWFTARLSGLPLLWPFSKTKYSVYRTADDDKGNYDLRKKLKKADRKRLLESYYENKILLGFEFLIACLGLLSILTLIV